MSISNRIHKIQSLLWQILMIGYICAPFALLLWNNTAFAANSQPNQIEVSANPVNITVPMSEKQKTAKDSFILNLEGVEYEPGNTVPYEVYLNLPPGVQPEPESPYYVGKIALFAHPQGATYSLDVTDVVQWLRNADRLNDGNLSVTIVPPKPGKFITSDQAEGRSPRLPTPAIRFKRVSITS